MSRKPRFMLPGVPQHVIQRGHNREPCFFLDDDYHRYLRDLQESAVNNQVSVHAYVLMTNHLSYAGNAESAAQPIVHDAGSGTKVCALYQS